MKCKSESPILSSWTWKYIIAFLIYSLISTVKVAIIPNVNFSPLVLFVAFTSHYPGPDAWIYLLNNNVGDFPEEYQFKSSS